MPSKNSSLGGKVWTLCAPLEGCDFRKDQIKGSRNITREAFPANQCKSAIAVRFPHGHTCRGATL